MNILICDDEYQYIEQIKNNVANFFNEISQPVSFDTFTDGDMALESCTKRYDIAFLDIEIGDVKGTQIAEKMKLKNPHTLFFFITAYERYLDDALDLQAFRFLTKPLDMKRLLNGLKAATNKIDKLTIEFTLKDNRTNQKVFSNDIVFIEISGRNSRVVTIDGEFSSNNKIGYWAERLPSTHFYRIHNSIIVNVDYVTSFTREMVVLNKKYRFSIAYRARTQFKRFYTKRIEELQG